MRITVTVDKWQPKHAYTEAFQGEEIALGAEFAYRVCNGWRAGVVFSGETATRRAIDQSGAREDSRLSWATIAAATGYYDQAHLIEEFRTIAGVTPRALLSELGAAS
jgi:AraC-like DNA-binding protein